MSDPSTTTLAEAIAFGELARAFDLEPGREVVLLDGRPFVTLDGYQKVAGERQALAVGGAANCQREGFFV